MASCCGFVRRIGLGEQGPTTVDMARAKTVCRVATWTLRPAQVLAKSVVRARPFSAGRTHRTAVLSA